MPERLVPAIDIGPFEHGSAGEKRSIAARVALPFSYRIKG